ncbi:MAG: CHAT domain-containing protein [Chloroflexi bacterium]|nr:CHAT domain-containing protein [Chloroflexota bacterium]
MLDEADLAAVVAPLPPIGHELLEHLAEQAEQAGQCEPRYGWAVAYVADRAASHQAAAPLLQAKAAWYLGRAANAYVRPNLAAAAIERAYEIFANLGENNWVAACNWQRHSLPWAQPDLRQTIIELEAALVAMEQADRTATQAKLVQVDFAPHCRLTLAYAQTLAGEFAVALQNLERSEQLFTGRQDLLNQAYCWLIKAGALRRQSLFDQAISWLEKAQALFRQLSAPVGAALAQSQLAYSQCEQWLEKGQYAAAEANFLEAASQFAKLDLPFWQAYCRNGLIQIYITTGRLAKAGKVLTFIRQVYEQYDVLAPQASALIESGWLEMYRGNHQQSLTYLAQAEQLCRRVGNAWLYTITLMHLGEVYIELGRYQQALHYLEKAVAAFQFLNSPSRLAECELRLARCWTYLGRPELTHEYLDQADKHARQANQPSILPYLHNRRAEAFFAEGKKDETIATLEAALAAARQQGDPGGIALAGRLLGEALCATGRLEEAAGCLQAAEKSFATIGLVIEQAACQVAWGHYHSQASDTASAQAAWQQALELVHKVAPDIAWQAHAGLAAQAEAAGDMATALRHYRQAIEALGQLRRELWQPALAGSYLNRPAPVLDRAVTLAVGAGDPEDVLAFIEASKAQTVARQLSVSDLFEPAMPLSQELADLKAEIRWLQEHLRASFTVAGQLPPSAGRQLRHQLWQKARQYDEVRGRLERQQASRASSLGQARFDLDDFRRVAGAALGESWLALDYYLTEEQLNCVVITPQNCYAWHARLTSRVRLALGSVTRSREPGHWQQADLHALGHWLLPERLWSELLPDTVLMIAPHRQLHWLPWSALELGVNGQPLMMTAIPVIIPSLYSLALLWQRPVVEQPILNNGLLLTLSDFQGRHPTLSQIAQEATMLKSYLGPGGWALCDEAATWSNILELSREGGLARFSFLHLASHAFHDAATGRLSGLALYDRDVWIDELWDCAPLPSLVVLSTCSSSKSRLYEGDEHVGLATTCLAAGARHVVASLWPVLDQDAANLMATFYSHLAASQHVATALAHAQRAARQSGKTATQWAGFRCTGQP